MKGSQSRFAIAPSANIQRSQFDRSCNLKTTFNASDLVPIFCDEALPGDTFNLRASFFARLNTPIKPILDDMFFETFFFEVPVRQVWNNWEKFNGEQDNPGDSTDFLIPQTSPPPGGYVQGSIEDHLGLPVGIENFEHSAIPLRACNHVYNTWFRDQNLQDSLEVPRGDGPDTPTYKLFKRGKRHDYFTSALPWPQKSDSGSVSLPIGTSAPVLPIDRTTLPPTFFADGAQTIERNLISSGGTTNTEWSGAVIPGANVAQWGNPNLYADLSDATAATINQLRQSIAVQRLFEADARGGSRYIEVIKQHFKVTSPDLRLQRPGFLGGGRTQINISPVAQTTDSFATSGNDTPQGNLAAIGTLSANNHGFTKSFTEHTIIIGFCNVRAALTYQNNLERMWSRKTRFDFFWPELATIGEQEVLTKEINTTGTAQDEVVWGYQERFAEYRYKPSQITGKMRSVDPQSLDIWHLSQDLVNPVLNSEFITEDVPIARIVATVDEPDFKLDAYFKMKCARPMPMYGIPGLDKL